MRNLCMKVSYDGTDYCGFQTQPDGSTVQDALEKAIKLLTGEEVKIHASGRTDAGVHARGQVFNFITSSEIPVERWCIALNSRPNFWYAMFSPPSLTILRCYSSVRSPKPSSSSFS